MADEDLLTPSLGETKTRPIYSVGAMIAAAFFGGGVAVPFLATLNSRRLARLGRDALWLAAGLVAGVAAPLAVLHLQEAGVGDAAIRDARIVNRLTGFVLAAAYYRLHRDAYRTMKIMGLEAPSPWIPVIGVVIGAVAVLGVSMAVYRAL